MIMEQENGLDNVVLYSHEPSGRRFGVPWSGVKTISNESGLRSTTGVYVDSTKVSDHVIFGDYKGKLSSYSHPTEFYTHDGHAEVLPGLYLDEQLPTRFSLVYRTRVGVSGNYKLHILYNLLALPDSTQNSTMSNAPAPILDSWSLSGVPEVSKKHRPTNHIVVDSRLVKESVLKELEVILYGSDEDQPELPDLQFLIDNVLYQTFVLTDITTDTWTLIGPDHLMSIDDEGIFTVDGIRVIFHDDDTYTIIDDYEE